MKCFYCKVKLPITTDSDVCESCELFFENTEEYDEDLQRDIDSVVNKTGVTPPRYIDWGYYAI